MSLIKVRLTLRKEMSICLLVKSLTTYKSRKFFNEFKSFKVNVCVIKILLHFY